MRINAKPGEVTVDIDDPIQAATLINAILHGGKKQKALPAPKPKVLAPADVTLTKQMLETWQWLVAHDNEGGVTSAQVAAGLKLNQSAATWRLKELVGKGVVYRLSRGYYRPGERGDG